MDIQLIQQIIAMLKGSDITDFELEQEGKKLKVSRGTTYAPAPNAGGNSEYRPAIVPASHHAHPVAPEAPKQEINENFIKVESPIVGTFYRKPSPDAEPFINVGSIVKKGDTLCIIEAMKLMNEIESPCNGRVEKILLSDGKVVEYGELLFLINPNV
jgi:acetyl-CoA carboxylase biotin carboxyl carrier protein